MPNKPIVLPPVVIECQALRDLADHAETLLCNALPMAHCPPEEWHRIITEWRDKKNALRADLKLGEKLPFQDTPTQI